MATDAISAVAQGVLLAMPLCVQWLAALHCLSPRAPLPDAHGVRSKPGKPSIRQLFVVGN